MDRQVQWNLKVLGVTGPTFEETALEVFRLQYQGNAVYRAFVDALHLIPGRIDKVLDIPFLPISFFKSHSITSGDKPVKLLFESSGTTGAANSRHLLADPGLYEQSFLKSFTDVFGDIKKYCVLGLLPSYLERSNSSLVYMVDRLIRESGHASSGFYLNDLSALNSILRELEAKGQEVLLFGVTYALLDFAKRFPMPLKHTIIIETGGMKGRKVEMLREEVHSQLKNAFGIPKVYSEYGMTELLSQGWSKGEGIFRCPPWMKVVCRDEEDPFNVSIAGTGAINIIDLANIHSCSFIATDDAGKIHADGSFEVLGRLDGSDLRGCSLLAL